MDVSTISVSEAVSKKQTSMSNSLKRDTDLPSRRPVRQKDCRLILDFHQGIDFTSVDDPTKMAAHSDSTPLGFRSLSEGSTRCQEGAGGLDVSCPDQNQSSA